MISSELISTADSNVCRTLCVQQPEPIVDEKYKHAILLWCIQSRPIGRLAVAHHHQQTHHDAALSSGIMSLLAVLITRTKRGRGKLASPLYRN
eukprot:6198042-Pleurochrysis_carterae.AAC.2